MAMLAELQRRFAQALLTGTPALLAGLLVDDRLSGARRFTVHLNTFYGQLGEALEAAFPVVHRLVGTPFFQRTCQVFVSRHPPAVPHLAEFGGAFPDFLAAFPPAASVPYLADVARLEWARVSAYFAADAPALKPETLARLPPNRLPDLMFRLPPSLALITSPWAIVAIWQAHQAEMVAPVSLTTPETALVWRFADQVRVTSLSPGDAALMAAFARGASLAEAAEAALAREPELDLERALAHHLAQGHFAQGHFHEFDCNGDPASFTPPVDAPNSASTPNPPRHP